MNSTDAHAPWPVHPLQAVVERIFTGLPVSRHQARQGEPSILETVLSVGDLDSGRIVPNRTTPKTALRKIELERFRIQTDDILVSSRGTQLKAARVQENASSFLASSNLIIIRPSEKIHPAILLALINDSNWQDKLRLRSRSSAGHLQLTTKDLENLPVPVPPRQVQSKLARLIEAEEEHYENALRAANLRRALVANTVSDVLSPAIQKEEPND